MCPVVERPVGERSDRPGESGEKNVDVPTIPPHLACSCECGTETHDLALKANCGDYNYKACRTGTGVEKKYQNCREIGVPK
jgi:hypothetical protein